MRKNQGTSRVAVGFGFLVAVGLGIALLAKGLYPTDLPASRSPDFVDNIFDNRGVLWVARLLLVSAGAVLAFGGAFLVVSIGIRMKNREWLRRAGPFEISEGKLSQAEDEIEFWRRTALAKHEELVNLQEQLRQSGELIGNLRNLR